MDALSSAASSIARNSTVFVEAAAGELAKQANSLSQLTVAKDPIAWITGEDGADNGEYEDDALPPPELIPVPLAALRPWGAIGCYGSGFSAGGSSASTVRDGDGGFYTGTSPSAGSSRPDNFSGMHTDGASNAAPKENVPRRPPWGADDDLNGKVILWEGDLCSVEADALVVPTAAGYACGASTTLARVLRFGRKDLKSEMRYLDPCRSGEARICKSYGLPCQRLILTIGPKYKDKYVVAAQNTMNACYRESLQLLVEAELRTVAIPCIWYHKGYPSDEQAHVALRTIRRCLEKLRKGIDTLVLVAMSHTEFELYDGLMPLYFPRTSDEAESASEQLHDSCWHTWGEVALEERRIRVSDLISHHEDDDRGEPLFTADDRGFLDAREDADSCALRRLEGTMTEAEDSNAFRQAFLRYFRRAQELPADPPDRRFVFRAEKQNENATKPRIVVVLGARLPALGLRDERTLALFVKEMELLRGERFALLYANTGVDVDSSKLEVLQEILTIISARYRDSLDLMLVLHPGLWFRAAFVVGRAVSDTAAQAWQTTVYLESLQDLVAYGLNPDLLGLPEYVRAYEYGGS